MSCRLSYSFIFVITVELFWKKNIFQRKQDFSFIDEFPDIQYLYFVLHVNTVLNYFRCFFQLLHDFFYLKKFSFSSLQCRKVSAISKLQRQIDSMVARTKWVEP